MSADEMQENLQALLAVTPAPPDADAEPTEILARLGVMLAARTPLFRSLETALSQSPSVPPTCLPLIEELQERDRRWAAAATRARHVMAERMVAARRLRKSYR